MADFPCGVSEQSSPGGPLCNHANHLRCPTPGQARGVGTAKSPRRMTGAGISQVSGFIQVPVGAGLEVATGPGAALGAGAGTALVVVLGIPAASTPIDLATSIRTLAL